MNLNDARTFVEAVNEGSFSSAARALGVPKSTVSKRVAELERALGVTLAHRSTRRFVPTPIGREFYTRAAAMVALADEAAAVVRGSLAEPSGLVRVTSSLPTAQTWLAPLLPQIALRYPALRVVHHATDRFVDVVREGFDVAIRSHVEPLADSSLVARKIAVEPFWLVASPSYLAARGSPRTPDELASHDMLLTSPSIERLVLSRDDEPRTTTKARATAAAIVVPVRGRYFADESEMLLAAARAGLGITGIPAKMARADLAARRLRRVLPKHDAGRITTTVLVPERRAELPAVRVLIDAFVEAGKADTLEPEDTPARPRGR